MNPLQPVISTPRQISNRVKQGVPIPPFTGKTILSKAKHNEVLAVVNALANPKVDPPSAGKISISDVDITYALRGGSSGSGSGNLNWRGLYDAGSDYEALDVVYTNQSATRITWVAEIANGPSTVLQVPVWPEFGTVYWRALDIFSETKRFTLVSCPGTIDGDGHVTNGDYVVGRPAGGLGDGSQDVAIAKPYKMRLGLTTVTEFGVTYNFTYTATGDPNNPSRTKKAGATTELETIIPIWTPGDEFLATSCDTGVVDSLGHAILWEMMHPRFWAKIGTGS